MLRGTRQQLWRFFCYDYRLFHKTDQIWHSFSFGNWLVSFPILGHTVHVFCNQSQELLKKLVSFLFIHTFFLFQLLIICHVICINNYEIFLLIFLLRLHFFIKPIKFGIPSHLAIGSSPFLNWDIQFMCSAIKIRSCKLQFLCWPFPPIIGDIICLVQQKYNSLTNIVNS